MEGLLGIYDLGVSGANALGFLGVGIKVSSCKVSTAGLRVLGVAWWL